MLFFFRDNMHIDMDMLVVFLGKCIPPPRQTAAKCCELKRCADRVSSRTDHKDEVLQKQIS